MEAIQWVRHLGLHAVRIETDSKTAATAIKGRDMHDTTFGDIIREGIDLMT